MHINNPKSLELNDILINSTLPDLSSRNMSNYDEKMYFSPNFSRQGDESFLSNQQSRKIRNFKLPNLGYVNRTMGLSHSRSKSYI